jgi:hypothetical protein
VHLHRPTFFGAVDLGTTFSLSIFPFSLVLCSF